jgi:hypothetical protein
MIRKPSMSNIPGLAINQAAIASVCLPFKRLDDRICPRGSFFIVVAIELLLTRGSFSQNCANLGEGFYISEGLMLKVVIYQ